MIYFIPGWYAGREWAEREQYWHARRMRSEFDDTVKHIQLFHRRKVAPFRIVLLSFTPNFRHFLHRQGVYHAPYWSCFDAIQCIERKKAALLSFHNIKWPKDVEFVYSMFAVIAMLDGKKYAEVEFGEDGNPIEIRMFSDGRLSRTNIYDDRGFVSSSIVHEDGKPAYQDYLNEKGIWKVRRHFSDGHVTVNEKHPRFRLESEQGVQEIPFAKSTYASMEELLQEVFAAYVSKTQDMDIFCAAMHPLHLGILERVLIHRNLILSFYEDRCALDSPEAVRLTHAAGQIICDSRENEKMLEKRVPDLRSCTVIPPYDTRPDYGISQQITFQKILVPVDGMDEQLFEPLFRTLCRYLPANENAQIHILTRQADYGREAQLLERVRRCLALENMDEGYAAEKDTKAASENGLDSEDSVPVRVFVNQCVTELAVSKCLREQRIIVDFRKKPDTYLRVTAISMGIPQLLAYPSEFMVPGKNGMLLQNVGMLPASLRYYLDSLAHWNEAMIQASEIGKRFNTAQQLSKWKGVMDSFE